MEERRSYNSSSSNRRGDKGATPVGSGGDPLASQRQLFSSHHLHSLHHKFRSRNSYGSNNNNVSSIIEWDFRDPERGQKET